MARVKVALLQCYVPGDHGDVDGIEADCRRCGLTETVYGTSEASERRVLVMMRENCPRRENNFYVKD